MGQYFKKLIGLGARFWYSVLISFHMMIIPLQLVGHQIDVVHGASLSDETRICYFEARGGVTVCYPLGS